MRMCLKGKLVLINLPSDTSRGLDFFSEFDNTTGIIVDYRMGIVGSVKNDEEIDNIMVGIFLIVVGQKVITLTQDEIILDREQMQWELEEYEQSEQQMRKRSND